MLAGWPYLGTALMDRETCSSAAPALIRPLALIALKGVGSATSNLLLLLVGPSVTTANVIGTTWSFGSCQNDIFLNLLTRKHRVPSLWMEGLVSIYVPRSWKKKNRTSSSASCIVVECSRARQRRVTFPNPGFPLSRRGFSRTYPDTFLRSLALVKPAARE